MIIRKILLGEDGYQIYSNMIVNVMIKHIKWIYKKLDSGNLKINERKYENILELNISIREINWNFVINSPELLKLCKKMNVNQWSPLRVSNRGNIMQFDDKSKSKEKICDLNMNYSIWKKDEYILWGLCYAPKTTNGFKLRSDLASKVLSMESDKIGSDILMQSFIISINRGKRNNTKKNRLWTQKKEQRTEQISKFKIINQSLNKHELTKINIYEPPLIGSLIDDEVNFIHKTHDNENKENEDNFNYEGNEDVEKNEPKDYQGQMEHQNMNYHMLPIYDYYTWLYQQIFTYNQQISSYHTKWQENDEYEK